VGKDEKNKPVSYFINVCGFVDDDTTPVDCNNKKVQLCVDDRPWHLLSKKFYYEGMFHLNTSAVENYGKFLYCELVDPSTWSIANSVIF